MPTLKTQRETKDITLPNTGAKVTIHSEIVAGDMNKLNFNTQGGNPSANISPTDLAFILIQDWDFTNEEGDDLPVTKRNVELLPMDDFTAIIEEASANGFLENQMKSPTTGS